MSCTLKKTELSGDIVTRILPNQTKQQVLKKYGCRLTDLEYNVWRAGAWLVIHKSSRRTHIVRPLETLPKIAEKYGTTADALASLNKLKNNCVFIGQQLFID